MHARYQALKIQLEAIEHAEFVINHCMTRAPAAAKMVRDQCLFCHRGA